ncbi:MAG: hypothetical protein ACI81R_002680 [Bradymonadia bacterium]|jgi:hypothetical protein
MTRKTACSHARILTSNRATRAGLAVVCVGALAFTAPAGAQEPAPDVVVQAEVAQPSVAQPSAARVEPATCTYRTYQWSTIERRGVNRRTVEKAYADVTDIERSPDEPRCTVCREDQVMLDPADFGIDDDPIGVCWVYADAVRAALTAIAADPAFDLVEVTAYRPGQTRGRLVDGLRTGWSNHSFGTAIDINADHNGLYRSCNVEEVNSSSIRECSLGIGGHWDPESRPTLSVTADTSVYRAFVQQVGWLWGGEIEGSTRDLMHFSLTGF